MCYRPDRFDVQQEPWIKDENNNGKNADFQLRSFLFPPGSIFGRVSRLSTEFLLRFSDNQRMSTSSLVLS